MSQMTDRDQCPRTERLNSLIGEFFDSRSSLGKFTKRSAVPEPFGQLLDHEAHMTVTVEAFHRSMVDVVVHRTGVRFPEAAGAGVDAPPLAYNREITLVTKDSGSVVQYGIVRLDPAALAPHVWREIESETIPLGRVLINHQVMRDVKLCQLWCVEAGPTLAERLRIPVGSTTYGRTALIYCDRRPAIELLEIVRVCD